MTGALLLSLHAPYLLYALLVSVVCLSVNRG